LDLDRDKLLEILGKLGVDFEVEIFQPFEKYIENLSHASFLGLLSEKESYPQSINEANAIGVPAVVAKPWGENFSGRSRTLVVNLAERDEEIAEEVYRFLEDAPKQPRPRVPAWNEVALTYLSIYNGST